MTERTLKRIKGKPCNHGHDGWRYFTAKGVPGNCCECVRIRKNAQRRDNPLISRAQRRRYKDRRALREGREPDSRKEYPILPWLHPDGYMRIRLHGKLIAVHTVVMENQLGRRLKKSESVHHKNGDKADNRPENLELWSKSQPAGQRVEDKLVWAREIIALYG